MNATTAKQRSLGIQPESPFSENKQRGLRALSECLREGFYLLLWRCARKKKSRETAFQRLFKATASAEKRFIHLRRHANETLRDWLQAQKNPPTAFWDWGSFKVAVQTNLGDALVPALDSATNDTSERIEIRVRAVRALGELGGDAALRVLVHLAGSAEPIMQEAAASVLKTRGVNHLAITPGLIQLLGRDNREDRLRAARTITVLEIATPALLTTLAKMVKDPNHLTMESAAETLVALGGKAIAAVEILTAIKIDEWERSENRQVAGAVILRIQNDYTIMQRKSVAQQFLQDFPPPG